MPSGLAPKGPTVDGTVTRVVDGDTVHVDVDGQDVTRQLTTTTYAGRPAAIVPVEVTGTTPVLVELSVRCRTFFTSSCMP